MAVKRLALEGTVLDMVHSNIPAPAPSAPVLRAPAAVDLLAIGPGDAHGRTSYFDQDQRAALGGALVRCAGATFHDYRNMEGGKTHRICTTLPPSTEARLRSACGGALENPGAVLVALAEWALERLAEQGAALSIRSAADPWRTERLAARRAVVPRPPDRKKH